MKKTAWAVMVILGITVAGRYAGATTIGYNPSAAAPSIPAGTSSNVIVSINLVDPKGPTYFVWPVSTVSEGNLPREWITAAPSSLFLGKSATAQVTLTVAVPSGTESGTYSTTVFARAITSHDVAEPGTGLGLEVTVPSACSGVPTFKTLSAEPLLLWPPDHTLRQFTIRGTAAVPSGCELSEVGYVIEDEYGVYSGMGSVAADAEGVFTIVLPLEAWREGNDKDGRHYSIKLYASDEAGAATGEPWEVIVPHDKGVGGD